MSAQPQLRALTSVRGIAAWMVVLYHIRFAIDGLPAPIVAALGKGYLAVDFFFLLSGFVIWMTWAERLRGGGWRAVPAFFQRRIARIWPLHAFVLSGAVALAIGMAALGHQDPHRFPFAELPLHYLMLQNWGFTDHLTWNDPAWSISCEFGAYLLFPLVAWAVDWRRVPSSAIIAAIVALGVALHGVMSTAGAPTLGWEIPRLGLVRCLIEFAMGAAVHALWLRWRDQWQLPATGAALTAAALLLCLASGWIAETLAVPLGFAALLLALALTAARPGNPLAARWLHYLGEISYATYLGHFLLWHGFKLALVDDPYHVPLVLIALYLVLVLGCSVALHHLVERPAQRFGNALILPGTGRGTAGRRPVVEGAIHQCFAQPNSPSTIRFADGPPPRSGEDLTLPRHPEARRSPPG
jgi:peptidoglycan/LPS O-acetylase OafA/YrhL